MPTVTGHAFVPNQFSYFQALVSACRTKNPTKALEVRYIYTCMHVERRNVMQNSYSGQCSVTEYFVVQYVVQCSIVQDSAHCTFRFLILIIISFDHSPCYSSPLSFAHPCRTSPFHASFHTIPLRCILSDSTHEDVCRYLAVHLFYRTGELLFRVYPFCERISDHLSAIHLFKTQNVQC